VKRKKGTDMPNPDFAEQSGNGQLNEAAPTDDVTYKAVAEYLTNLITENKTLKERLLATERNNEQLNALCSEHEAKLKAVAEALGRPSAAPQ